MLLKDILAVFACAGAIVGAGFASGREVISFFSRYGMHSWWLILLTVLVIVWLCRLCMRRAEEWMAGLESSRRFTLLVPCGLMAITAGAMLSAAGHLFELLWPYGGAYAAGVAITIILAWKISGGSIRVLGWISALLSILLTGVLVYALFQPAQTNAALIHSAAPSVLKGAAAAVSYASMNIMLAIGVVSRCGKSAGWTPWGTAAVIGSLLAMSNALYLKNPQVLSESMPMISFLAELGRKGYIIGAALLYSAVFTTLASVMSGLRTALDMYFDHGKLGATVAFGLPIALSCVGFSGIVDHLYAPAGLVCLLAVFIPMQFPRGKQT